MYFSRCQMPKLNSWRRIEYTVLLRNNPTLCPACDPRLNRVQSVCDCCLNRVQSVCDCCLNRVQSAAGHVCSWCPWHVVGRFCDYHGRVCHFAEKFKIKTEKSIRDYNLILVVSNIKWIAAWSDYKLELCF